MSRFGETKGALFGTLDKITDLLILSMIFLLSSVPVFTMGASFSALYYTVNKVNRHSRGYLWTEFFGSFKKNFKQATLTWLIFMAIGAVLIGDLVFVVRVMESSPVTAALNIFFILLATLLIMWGGYVFPYIARFEDRIGVTLKNCALIAILNFPKSLLVLLILAGGGIVIYLFLPLIIIVPSAGALWQSDILEDVFRKYMSDDDKAMEDERNAEWRDK